MDKMSEDLSLEELFDFTNMVVKSAIKKSRMD